MLIKKWLWPAALAFPLAMLWVAAAHAERGFGISSNPDTQTRFVWAGAKTRAESGVEMMLLVQNGGRKYEVSLATAVEVYFTKSDLGKIKWCSYAIKAPASPKTSKKCVPGGTLKPDDEINIP